MQKFKLFIIIILLILSSCGKQVKDDTIRTSQGMLRGVFHKVERGETLYILAMRYNVDLEDILEINDLDPKDIVFVGDEIFIPTSKKIEKKIVKHPHEMEKKKKKITKKKRKKKKKISNKLVKRKKRRGKRKGAILPEKYINSFAWPVDGVVVSKFGKYGTFHNDGIDIAIVRNTPILAVLSGEVIYSGFQKGYGNIVIIQHANKIITIYAHNQKNLVRSGKKIRKGYKIALVGDSGNSERTKLHFEIRKGTKPANPIIYLK